MKVNGTAVTQELKKQPKRPALRYFGWMKPRSDLMIHYKEHGVKKEKHPSLKQAGKGSLLMPYQHCQTKVDFGTTSILENSQQINVSNVLSSF